jgi:hypothetical protein
MKLSIAVPGALATLVTVAAASHVTAAPVPSGVASTDSARQAPAARPGEIAQFGHIRSLVRKGRRYELRFDPAWWLGGVTANRAAVEDKAIPPGETVPNDYYVRDETHRLLTYLVPVTARVRVLVNPGPGGVRPVTIGVAELAQVVTGRNPRNRALYDDANHLGYWARVAIDTVRSLDQQYQP